MYNINGYSLFRNDGTSTANNIRPYGGTAVYSQIDYYPGYSYCSNGTGIEITVMRFLNLPHISIIGLYRSPRVPVMQLCQELREVLINCQLVTIYLSVTLILTGLMKHKEHLFNICLQEIITDNLYSVQLLITILV